MTFYPTEKRYEHLQATSFMSNFDDVNFPVTIASKLYFSLWVSPEHCDYPPPAIDYKPY
jgi:hypothetical protein